MESWCNWVTELELKLLDDRERNVLETFTLSGRAMEVAVPRVGEHLATLDGEGGHSARVVRVTLTGYQLIRRTNPWTWKTRYEVLLRTGP